MIQTQAILRSINKDKPKIFTLYTSISALRMLDDYNVYCLVNQHVSEPRTFNKENLPNVVFVNTYLGLEFDLCVSFSGGLYGKIVKDIARETNADYLIYELNYQRDIATQVKYITSDKNTFSPCNSFCDIIKGDKNIISPLVTDNFKYERNILDREIAVSTQSDLFLEKHIETNYDDLRFLFNTIPSYVAGFNPRLGTAALSLLEFSSLLNNSKIYLNTRTSGFFPFEILQAMACGCAVLSYDYPGIGDFIGNELVFKDKNSCRESISKILGNKELLKFISDKNLKESYKYRANQLNIAINNSWEDIREFGNKQYRV